MKTIKSLILALAAFFSLVYCSAQSDDNSFIPSTSLAITYNKTTNLIFPFAVQSIDRGSKDILVQQPSGTGNIVQVKADRPDFAQTNLSIITVDGQLYSFTVDYTNQPAQLNIIIDNKRNAQQIQRSLVQLSSGRNDAVYQSLAQAILAKKTRHIKRVKESKIRLILSGLYIHEDVLYFRLLLKNKSNITYQIDNISFAVKDKQKSRRTAVQETILEPVFSYGGLLTGDVDSTCSEVIALPKFTLPHSKVLFIQVLEKKGSRTLSLTLKNRKIIKAELI